jgi:hypothetical protein
MRWPVDRRCMAWDSMAFAAVLALPARSAAMFVPMTVMITPKSKKENSGDTFARYGKSTG